MSVLFVKRGWVGLTITLFCLSLIFGIRGGCLHLVCLFCFVAGVLLFWLMLSFGVLLSG